jgi:hypothetical protein
MTGKGYPSDPNRLVRWAASAVLLAVGWSVVPARAEPTTPPDFGVAKSAPADPTAGRAKSAPSDPATPGTPPRQLPPSAQNPVPTAGPEGKTDAKVVQAGCATCGGGLLGGPPEGFEAGSAGCAACCIPGRFHCCSPCCGDTCFGRILCGLYECVCCPDPCYEPHWCATANAAFFTDGARPITQMDLKFNGMYDIQHPDRAEFLIPASGAVKNFASKGVNGIVNPCFRSALGKGLLCIPASADINEISLYTEGAIDRVGIFIEMPYRSFDPTPSAADPLIGANCCHESGFGDMIIGTKTLLLDCELLQIAFQFKTFIPIGNFLQDLGVGHVSLEPALLFALKLAPDTYLQAEVAYWIPIGGDPLYEGDVFHAHVSLNHILWRILPDVQLIGTLEANAWSVGGGNYTAPFLAPVGGSAGTTPEVLRNGLGAIPVSATTNIFSAGPGIRLNICDRIDFGVGTAFALTGPRWAREQVRAEFRWRF